MNNYDDEGNAGVGIAVLALIFSVTSYFAIIGIIDRIAAVMCK